MYVFTHSRVYTILSFQVLRDMAQFFGSFEVSREGFESALEKRGSVLLVPGGQAEMVFAKSNQRETVIHTSHKGFVRLAMQSAAKSADLKQGKVYLVSYHDTVSPCRQSGCLSAERALLYLTRVVLQSGLYVCACSRGSVACVFASMEAHVVGK